MLKFHKLLIISVLMVYFAVSFIACCNEDIDSIGEPDVDDTKTIKEEEKGSPKTELEETTLSPETVAEMDKWANRGDEAIEKVRKYPIPYRERVNFHGSTIGGLRDSADKFYNDVAVKSGTEPSTVTWDAFYRSEIRPSVYEVRHTEKHGGYDYTSSFIFLIDLETGEVWSEDEATNIDILYE